MPAVNSEFEATSIGMTVAGVSRLGKWEMSGVLGVGRIRENSDARDVSGVVFGPTATKRLVFSERRVTRDCGVISAAYAGRAN